MTSLGDSHDFIATEAAITTTKHPGIMVAIQSKNLCPVMFAIFIFVMDSAEILTPIPRQTLQNFKIISD
jgi:hypothetical protein